MNAPQRSYRVLTGPTAAGKTDWLLHRAQHIPLVVVSADSRQAYRHMDIGTGKATTEERQKVTHFGLDFASPSEKISVFLYLNLTSEWLSELEGYDGEVWFCGGTGLYLRALTEGLQLGAPPQPEVRAWFETNEGSISSTELARSLGLTVTDPANPRRVLRAVEELCVTEAGRQLVAGELGIEISIKLDEKSALLESKSLSEETAARLARWQCIGIDVLDPGKAELERRIELRVKKMFHEGLLDEAAELTRLGYAEAEIVRDGIGYREALAVLAGELTLPAAIERTVIRTRQYAKRQRTYFRGMGWAP